MGFWTPWNPTAQEVNWANVVNQSAQSAQATAIGTARQIEAQATPIIQQTISNVQSSINNALNTYNQSISQAQQSIQQQNALAQQQYNQLLQQSNKAIADYQRQLANDTQTTQQQAKQSAEQVMNTVNQLVNTANKQINDTSKQVISNTQKTAIQAIGSVSPVANKTKDTVDIIAKSVSDQANKAGNDVLNNLGKAKSDISNIVNEVSSQVQKRVSNLSPEVTKQANDALIQLKNDANNVVTNTEKSVDKLIKDSSTTVYNVINSKNISDEYSHKNSGIGNIQSAEKIVQPEKKVIQPEVTISEAEKTETTGMEKQIVQPTLQSIQETDSVMTRINKLASNTTEYNKAIAQHIAENPAEFAKEVGIGMIPVVGTVYNWEKMSPLERGASVALDVASFIPFVGIVSSEVRAGTKLGAAFGRAALAEAKAPLTAIAHPIETLKAGAMPIETLLRSDKVPLTSLEIRTSTVRLPVADVGNAKNAKVARDILVDRAIKGGDTSLIVGDKQVLLSKTALNQNVIPAAVHSTPDVRPFLNGVTVQKGREGGLFVSPSLHTRFTSASAFGDIPKDGIAGAIIIRDDTILSKLKPSDKIYRGSAEMEKVLPAGTKLPAPSQMLMTRDAANNPLALVVVGTPFSKSEIAQMKLVGSADLVADIFKPAISVGGKATKYDELVNIGKEAKRLENDIRIAKESGESARTISKMQNELKSLNRDALRRSKALDREYATYSASNALRPLGFSTGDFVDRETYNEMARTSPRDLAYTIASLSRQERSNVIRGLSPEYRDNISRVVDTVLSGQRVTQEDIDRYMPIEKRAVIPILDRPDVTRPSYTPPERAKGREKAQERLLTTPTREEVTPRPSIPPVMEEGIPTTLPTRTGETPVARASLTSKGKIIIPLPDGTGKLEFTKKQFDTLIAWKQGMMYIMRWQPYGKRDIYYSRTPIEGVRYESGIGSVNKSLIAKGQRADIPDLNMGIVRADFSWGREGYKPRIDFISKSAAKRKRALARKRAIASEHRQIWGTR